MTYSGLQSLQAELLAAVKDESLTKARKELALLDEIDASQVEGYMPERPADSWLDADVMPLKLQTDIWTSVTLNSRWWNDPSRPKYSWELLNVTPKSSSVCSAPESIVPIGKKIEEIF